MNTTRHASLALASLGLALSLGLAGCTKAKAKIKGVGDSLQAFIVTNAETEERTCLVCAYGGQPTIMAVGDVNDEGFKKDLQKIQSLVDGNKAKSLTAFALYGQIKDGKFTALSNQAEARKKLDALRKELALTYPVALVPTSLTEKEKDYTPFADAYDIVKSRTVMLAEASNKVVFAEVLGASDAQYDALAEAVKKL